MSVCVYSVFVLSYVDSGLATADPPSKGSYRLCIGLRNWKSGQGSKGSRAVKTETEVNFNSSVSVLFLLQSLCLY
jgi:hypothetical protein